MKNRTLLIILYFLLSKLMFISANSIEQFNFNVTEVEILNNGNIIKGLKKGTVETDDGITITADTFEYNKALNILNANGNVKIIDTAKNLEIYSDNAIYEKKYRDNNYQSKFKSNLWK